MSAVLDKVDPVAIETDKQDAVNMLEKQAKELKHNGNAPGNTWRDTLDKDVWTYHDQYEHRPHFADCVECTHVIVYLKRQHDALSV